MSAEPNGELIPQGGGDNIPLPRSPLVLGRRETCDVCLQFANVSGKHCELTFRDGLWILRDLDSKNGTKVNDVRLEPGMRKVVHTGDLVTIGKRTFKMEYVETGRASDMDEYEDEVANIVGTSLLEKAGLAHAPRHAKTPPEGPKPTKPSADAFKLEEDE
jgi:adenylate cyclase